MALISRLAVWALLLTTCFLSAQARAEAVTFITDFGFNGRHSYFFVAQQKGFYREEGLEVSILRGQGSADAIRKVAAGTATFGFADAGSLVLARANDGIPVRLFSIVYASPPQAIFSLAERGITSPHALEGRTIADTASSAMRLMFPAYARAAGIDASKVTWVTADGAALASMLAAGRVDAIGQFTVGEPLLAAVTAPRPLARLAYGDAGLRYYGNGLVATEQTIATRPDLVRAFARATLRGLRYSMENPAEAGAIMNAQNRQVTAEVAAAETRLVGELAEVPGRPLGAIDPAAIQATIEVVTGAFSLRQPVRAEELFAPGLAE
ncbi:ABC transporter substrate-binding protein [Roseomonas chloroacetimidivorans]|jgi:NitT/TauT family transport system substrate-binding protein|uniref:ABC transporter substrate-binding protein n=1 Tax=Roseomonas chloroacetimidivorans TaxID=1766656 RepID=UPI003C73219D